MNTKTIILLVITLAVLGLGVKLILFPSKNPLINTSNNAQEEKTKDATKSNPQISKTVKSYTDASGFTFSYPDNLSMLNNELKDANTYADFQLTEKGVGGNLHLKISDSKLKTLDEWVKASGSKVTPKEAKLGNLKAMEITTTDKIMLASLDSGILFNIEVNFGGNTDYWTKVYKAVLKDFTFVQPTAETGSSSTSTSSEEAVTTSSEEVSYEGEEVVE